MVFRSNNTFPLTGQHTEISHNHYSQRQDPALCHTRFSYEEADLEIIKHVLGVGTGTSIP